MANTENGFRCMMRGKYLDAERAYLDALATFSGNGIALYELAWVYILQHKYPQAEQTLAQILEISPHNLMACYDAARIYMLQRKYLMAEQALLRCLSLAPEDPVLLYQLGRIYRLQNKHHDADRIFGKVEQLVPVMAVEQEQFFDSLIQLEPVQLDEESQGEMTVVDPAISVTPQSDSSGAALRASTQRRRHYKDEISTVAAQKTAGMPQITMEEAFQLHDAIFDDILTKEKLLGQGGMGEVFLVYHSEWDKRMAIKRCLHTDNPAIVERFRQECLNWLLLEKHPNIVSAVHYTVWEGKPSLLIEYIEGKNLKSVLREENITFMAEQILDTQGPRPALSETMSRFTFFGITEERQTILEAWATIVKQHGSLSIAEVKDILAKSAVFSEEEIEYLQNKWPGLPAQAERHRLDILSLLDYGIQICLGMAHAHRHGMLHRDLKPANILIEQEIDGGGILKVTDFGLAKMKYNADKETAEAIDEAKESGDESGIVGTPRYMAPEQWDNIASEKSDIYAFGMILYELFTRGHLPYVSHIDEKSKNGNWWSNVAKQNEFYYWSVRHCSEQPISPSVYNSEIPDELGELIIQCLAKDGEARPKSFSHLAGRLLNIYRDIAGQEYPREENIAPELMAIELNNRAISLLEMGYNQEGHHVLDRALRFSPNLIEVQLNHSLLDLQSGRLSLDDFLSKTLNCFDNSDRDIKVLDLLLGIYLQYGCCNSLIAEKLPVLEQKFPENRKVKRIKAKYAYLQSGFAGAAAWFAELCQAEKNRIEDWYHYIGALYHQGDLRPVTQAMQTADHNFRSHRCFKEVKKLLGEKPGAPGDDENQWYEIAVLDTSYPDMNIYYCGITSDDRYLVIYCGNLKQNICQVLDLANLQSRNFRVPLPNRLYEKHIAALPGGNMAVLSLAGCIYIQKIADQKNIVLKARLPLIDGYECQDGYLHVGQSYIVAVFLLQDHDNWLSYLAFWKIETWQCVGDISVPGQVRHIAFNESGKTCWMATDDTLYTWGVSKNLPPQGQKYGYRRKLPSGSGEEHADIAAVHYIIPNKLIVIKQSKQIDAGGTVLKGALHLYLWDLQNAQGHHSARLYDVVLLNDRITPDRQKMLLLYQGSGSENFLVWDIAGWQQENKYMVPQSYKSMKISRDGQFVFFNKSGSFLDDFDDLTSANQPQYNIYRLTPWQPISRFAVKDIEHFASTFQPGTLVFTSEDAKIHIWKSVFLKPFTVEHRLSYLYLQPSSTLQDIGLQKRINMLLVESDCAAAENHPHQALEYLRSIQKFRGYEWDLVMKRIYRISHRLEWSKLDLRESLKIKKLVWPYRDFTLSPNGEYLAPIGTSENEYPKLWEMNTLQLARLPKIISKEPEYGRWLVSRDGRYVLVQRVDKLKIYDLQQQKLKGEIEYIPIKIQEAMASRNGEVMVLKEEGFGKIVILEMDTLQSYTNVLQSRYHNIQDSCTIHPDGDKILFANECQGGFQWELLKRDEQWQARTFQLDFTEAHMYHEDQAGDQSELNLIANRSYVIFRGANFDFVHDIQFRHIEVFELRHEVYFSLKEEVYRKIWLGAHAITTTPDGKYTFLSNGTGDVAVWRTAGHIKNWQQVFVVKQHQHSVWAMTVTAEGRFLICADAAGYITINKIGKVSKNSAWQAGDWEPVGRLKADEPIRRLYLSNNDRYLFAVSESAVHVWQFDWLWDIEQSDQRS